MCIIVFSLTFTKNNMTKQGKVHGCRVRALAEEIELAPGQWRSYYRRTDQVDVIRFIAHRDSDWPGVMKKCARATGAKTLHVVVVDRDDRYNILRMSVKERHLMAEIDDFLQGHGHSYSILESKSQFTPRV
jgi:hypothetical protein